MVKELLKRVIEQKNPFMTREMILLQIEFFSISGRLTEQDKAELMAMLGEDINETGEEY